VISPQEMDHANEAARSNNASLQSARKQVAGAETQVSLADAQVKAAHAQVQQVQEAVQQAELNLSYTKIVSPTDGQVAQRTVESGNRVQPGQALMAISEPDVWVAYVARRDALLTPDRWDMKGERGQSNRTGSSAVVGKASRLTPPTWIGSAVWIRKGNSSRDQIHKSRQRRTECGFLHPRKMGNSAGHLGTCQGIEEEVMEIGQKVVFVRDVKGAEVGKHGTVMSLSDNMVIVDCKLQEHVAPVLAQMWDVLPERLWNRLLRRRNDSRPMTVGPDARFRQ
jgi:hypothetical protein